MVMGPKLKIDYKYKVLDKKSAEQIIYEKWENIDEFDDCDPFTPDHIIKNAHANGLSPGDFIPVFDDFYCQVVALLKTDDHRRFERLINSTDPDIIEDFPADGLYELICQHNAVACASVCLKYDVPIITSSQFLDSDYTPLDYCALHSSPALTQLFLQHHARPDEAGEHGFPLATALNNLCRNEYVKLWTKDKSIFKLLYILCLPELKEALDTIKLLASKMEHADNIYGDIVKHGDVCKLASLLVAAKDQLLVPSAEGDSDGNGSLETTPIGKYIVEKTAKLAVEKNPSVGFHTTFRFCAWQCKVLTQRLANLYNVAKILWKAVDVLDHYRTSEWIKK